MQVAFDNPQSSYHQGQGRISRLHYSRNGLFESISVLQTHLGYLGMPFFNLESFSLFKALTSDVLVMLDSKSVSLIVFQRLVLQTCKNQGLFGKGSVKIALSSIIYTHFKKKAL